MMLGSAESQFPKLIIRGIIFEVPSIAFHHNPPNLSYRWTDGQADGQLTISP